MKIFNHYTLTFQVIGFFSLSNFVFLFSDQIYYWVRSLHNNMSTKVEQASSHTRTNITSPSVAVSKTPIFAKKSGFVIPKNKLTGSLVPILRGKKGSSNTASEGSIKQVQRKTKWGPDLTQDTAVRKGRALAYQVSRILLQFVFHFCAL